MQKLEVSEEAVLEELKNTNLDNNYQAQTVLEENKVKIDAKNFTPEGRKKLLEDKVVSLILKDPYNLNSVKETDYCFFSGQNRQFLENLNKASSPIFASEGSDTEEKLKAIFADISQSDEYKDFLGTISLLAEVEFENDGPQEIELCLSQLKKLELKNELVIKRGLFFLSVFRFVFF